MTTETVVETEAWQSALPDIEKLCLEVFQACVDLAPGLLPGDHCCICFSDDKKVLELNRTFRGKPFPTNVLSFPSERLDPTRPARRAPAFIGDIILAFETVNMEARTQAVDMRFYASHLICHGILHLLGYDHITDEQAAVMEPLETHILKTLGFEDPYSYSV